MNNATSPSMKQAGGDPRRWRVLALPGVAQFMLILDMTVVALAMPQLGADRQGIRW
jgi:hypothetical protein